MTYIVPDDAAIRQDYLRSINRGRLPAWARITQPDPLTRQPYPAMSPLSYDWRDPRGPGAAGGSVTGLGFDMIPPGNAAIALVIAAGLLMWYRSRS